MSRVQILPSVGFIEERSSCTKATAGNILVEYMVYGFMVLRLYMMGLVHCLYKYSSCAWLLFCFLFMNLGTVYNNHILLIGICIVIL